MGIINKLDKNVYEKIAAGEVIDRPSSALRELLDNSFDAGAGKIKVTFKNAGLEELSVHDNGHGIYFDDLGASVLKHHTSKIKDFDDIFNTLSMGFRGEALSSIAAVSRLLISSYNKNDEHGGELYIEANSESVIKPAARSVGTSVKVKNLFYNVPARSKFIKSISGETRSIRDVFTKKTLPFNNVQVELYNDSKCILSRSSESLLSRIAEYNKTFLSEDNLIEIKSSGTDDEIKIYGYVSSSEVSYHNKTCQHVYINKRPVYLPSLYYAISSSYDGVLPGNRFAFAFIFVDINPALIDVNIHPAKKEVKVVSERSLTSLVKKSIENALKGSFYVPTLEIEKENPGRPENFNRSRTNEVFDGQSSIDAFLPLDISPKSNVDLSNLSYKEYRVIGLLFDTYILAEKDDEFYLIDYHAAHERMNYEALKSKFSEYSKNIPSQKLLTPLHFDLSDSDAQVLSQNIPMLNNMGYEIEDFGGESFAVYGLPAFKTYGDDVDVILKLLDRIKQGKDCVGGDYLLDELLKIESCRMSFKSGDNPDVKLLDNIVDSVLRELIPLTCPHGRPVVSKMNKKELDKKFKRI